MAKPEMENPIPSTVDAATSALRAAESRCAELASQLRASELRLQEAQKRVVELEQRLSRQQAQASQLQGEHQPARSDSVARQLADQVAWSRAVEAGLAVASRRLLDSARWRADEVPGVRAKGHLVKKKHSMSNIVQQRRFFVLIGHDLFYFASEEERKPKGVLDLRGGVVRVASSADLCFHVQSPRSSKAYFMFASSEAAFDEWVAVLCEATGRQPRLLIPPLRDSAPPPSESYKASLERAFVAWRSDQVLPESEMEELLRAMWQDALPALEALTQVLNKHRQAAKLSSHAAFAQLTRLVDESLTVAHEHESWWVVRKLLNMSNTFCVSLASGDGACTFIASQVRDHQVWRSLRTWSGVLFDALSLAVADQPIAPAAAAASAPESAADVGALAPYERVTDAVRRLDSNVVFGQLLSFANEMARFKLSFVSVVYFVLGVSNACSLSDAATRSIFEHVKAMYKQG